MGAGRRAVLGDGDRVAPRQCAPHRPSVAHRRAQHDDARVRAQVVGDAQQSAHDQRDVRAGDASPVVGLVDDDEAQRRQETRPALVRRKHHVVQEIRVRQDQVGAGTRPLLGLAGRVPVHGRRAHAAQPLIDEALAPFRVPVPLCVLGGHVLAEQRHERGQLVRGQGLRGGQVQGRRAAVDCGNARRILGLHQVGEDRGPRGQRLARPGPRREHDVAALAQGVHGLALVEPRALHTPARPRVHERRADPLRPIRDSFRAPRERYVADQAVVPGTQALQDGQQVGGGRRRRRRGRAHVARRRVIGRLIPGRRGRPRARGEPRVLACARPGLVRAGRGRAVSAHPSPGSPTPASRRQIPSRTPSRRYPSKCPTK